MSCWISSYLRRWSKSTVMGGGYYGRGSPDLSDFPHGTEPNTVRTGMQYLAADELYTLSVGVAGIRVKSAGRSARGEREGVTRQEPRRRARAAFVSCRYRRA